MSNIHFDRQGFVRINGVLLSPHEDDDGIYLRGGLWVQTGRGYAPDAYTRADKLIPCATILPPLNGVRGRAGWTVRVELDDAERLLAA